MNNAVMATIVPTNHETKSRVTLWRPVPKGYIEGEAPPGSAHWLARRDGIDPTAQRGGQGVGLGGTHRTLVVEV